VIAGFCTSEGFRTSEDMLGLLDTISSDLTGDDGRELRFMGEYMRGEKLVRRYLDFAFSGSADSSVLDKKNACVKPNSECESAQ
jgi:hypothetical protein